MTPAPEPRPDPSRPPTFVCGGLSFKEAPVAVRERAAFRDEALPQALVRLRENLGLEEAVLLSTCNRVEFFGVGHPAEEAAAGGVGDAWASFLASFHAELEEPVRAALAGDFAAHSFRLSGRASIERLFRLASGLESMVVGETEIFGQVKEAYRVAAGSGATGKRLHRLFQASFSAAKEVRSKTQITRGSVSVGSVAVELAERLFGSLAGKTVMVLGAGATSERTARSLQGRGAGFLLVANRTYEKAEALAAELGGEAIHWDAFEARVEQADIVVSSTSAPHYVLTRERIDQVRRRRGGRPLFLIDLAVPRDIEPSVTHLPDVYLYDIDDLEAIARTNQRERSAEIVRCEGILAPHVEKLLAWEASLASSLADAQAQAKDKIKPSSSDLPDAGSGNYSAA
ncbi:glutamyl-tRNA reductase [Verrucomicrobium sp. GAS474]|uniref:glutamyl-tRNA reductase n=1 Tax=Verrucomicrobium sp. GAS474 TaxID=1882831 RepID=UPI00087AC43F|nr:glutamyl-tRNA reductase [Verrucomicrobium sp. GAS474]SDT96372.1 glutamyl-tRNA reductase [Verrucomicrobium sp. GAS474]